MFAIFPTVRCLKRRAVPGKRFEVGITYPETLPSPTARNGKRRGRDGLMPGGGALLSGIWSGIKSPFSRVLAGLDPAIHVFIPTVELVDARAKHGHDEGKGAGTTGTKPKHFSKNGAKSMR
jgi:hypothetical protein